MDDETDRSKLTVDRETTNNTSSGDPVTVPDEEGVHNPSPEKLPYQPPVIELPGIDSPARVEAGNVKPVVDTILDLGDAGVKLSDMDIITIKTPQNIMPTSNVTVHSGSAGYQSKWTKPVINTSVSSKPVTAVRNIKSIKSIPDVITSTIPAIDDAIRSGDPSKGIQTLVESIVNSPKAIVESLVNAGNAVKDDDAQTLVKEAANLTGISSTISAVEDVYNLITGKPQSNTWTNEVIEKTVPKSTTVGDLFKPVTNSNPVQVVTNAVKGISNWFSRLF